MGEREFRELCVEALIDYIRSHLLPADDAVVTKDKIHTVWLCKALQNNKGLFTTELPDGRYYECTFNGDKRELYVDCYVKTENICVNLGGE